MSLRAFVGLLLQAALLVALAPQAHADEWARLTSRGLAAGASQASIDVSRAPGQHKAIRLIAKSGSMTINRVVLTYANGTSFVEARTIRLEPGERTSPIGSTSEPRRLRKVDVTFAVPLAEGAILEVWGFKVQERAPTVADAKPPEAKPPIAFGRGAPPPIGGPQPGHDAAGPAPRSHASEADELRRQQEMRRLEELRRNQAAQDTRQARTGAARSARPETSSPSQPSVGAAPSSPPSGGTRGAVPPFAMAPPPAPSGGGARGVAPPPPPPAVTAPSAAPSAPVTTAPPRPASPPRAIVVQPSETAKPEATDAAKAVADKPYASVPVLFGTDRKQGQTRKAKWGGDVDTFLGEGQFKLALGKAIVTVPTKEGVRERGSVPRPELIVFGFRVPWGTEQLDQHFTVYSARKLDEADFLAEVRDGLAKSKSFEKHAILFVHGYNVTFEDSLYRTAQIAHDLEFDGAAFMYSWPSKGDPRAYLYDEDRAKGARPYLRQYLELIAEKTDVKNLHIVAHSKGAELLVEVLSAVTPELARKLRIHEIILAAPDIDRANFEQIADKFVGVAQRGVTLYASNNDKALSLSNTVRLGTVRAGEVPRDLGPVLVKGMDTIDISAASTDFFSSNHVTFAERQHLIRDMRSILASGQHPPDKRSDALFKAITNPRGLYWQYVR